MSRTPKPRLSDGRRVHADGRSPALAGTGQNARLVTGERGEPLPLRLLRNTVALVVLLATVAFLIYAVLAVTVLVVLRAGDHNVLVLRGAYPVGQAPTGSYVYVSSQPVDFTFLGKVEQATRGVPSGSVVQVVAGPGAAVSNDTHDNILADGKPTHFHGPVDAQTLGHEYLALCVSGSCKPGSAVIVGESSVVGGVKGYLTMSGLTTPAPARN